VSTFFFISLTMGRTIFQTYMLKIKLCLLGEVGVDF